MSPKLDELTKAQFDLANAVEKSLTNLKKDSGKHKRSTPEARAELVKKKRDEIDAQWTTFTQRHSEILTVGSPAGAPHNYFALNFYAQTHQLFLDYEKYLQKLEKMQTELPLIPNIIVNPSTPIHDNETVPQEGRPGAGENLLISDPPVYEEPTEVHPLVRKQRVELEWLDKCISNTLAEMVVQKPKSYWEYKKEYVTNEWNAVRHNQRDILISDEISQPLGLREDFDNMEQRFQQLMLALCEKISSGAHTTTEKIRIPETKVPQFGGDYQSWTSFHDIYLRVIHNNQTIGKAEKMQFLITSLKGEAVKPLQHLTISENNYDSAWEIICNRYNNKRILVSTQLNNMFNLPKLTKATAEDLRTLHDTINESVRAMGNLGFSTVDWDPLLVHLLQERLDPETRQLFEQSLERPKEVPSFKKSMEFIETRFQSLEMRDNANLQQRDNKGSSKKENSQTNSYHAKPKNCPFCKEQHPLYFCKKFTEITAQERFNFAKRENLCTRCLSHDKRHACNTNRICNKCNKKHHTLLHFDRDRENVAVPANVNVALKSDATNVVINSIEVLLATAVVKVKNYERGTDLLRVLIDQGSQLSFISQEAASSLGLPTKRASVEVSGVGGAEGGFARAKICAELCPRIPSDFKLSCELLVMKKVTSSRIPNAETDGFDVVTKALKNCYLADPNFNVPGPIDILLGADVIPYILKRGVRMPQKGCVAQNTEFGWVISGRIQNTDSEPGRTTLSMISTVTDINLSRFWEIEESPYTQVLSKEDTLCESFYNDTTIRNTDGTYTVCLPFKDSPDKLGETKKCAVARLLQVEKRFKQDARFEREYKRFMYEYEQLGHMELVPPSEEIHTKYIIPHHAVLKEGSSTTKLRVVFDGSAKSVCGSSLNELMHSGPRLQEDLSQLLLRWRKHAIVFAADIEKMYRQIKVKSDDRRYQTILWRYSSCDPIREYRLATVTYGTSSAPYLAVRSLQRLAADEEDSFPDAAKITKNDFYVDDMLSGSDNPMEAKVLQADILTMLSKGGFNLRKWKSNCAELVDNLPEQFQDKNHLEVGDYETAKMLGVHWAPNLDCFKYKVRVEDAERITKRVILSQTAQLYDPLGWLAPIMVRAKLLIQQVWMDDNDWDKQLTDDLRMQWLEFQEDLQSVENLEIPRWIQYNTGNQIQLHGFCDASERAYGAVVYSRVRKTNGEIHVTLLTAKSKVAPIKMRKTLPRLELCGAVLLAQLLTRVKEAMKIPGMDIFAWSDSMIALAWIKGRPERWNTFVGNRVGEIKQHVEDDRWHHVISEENPADLVSRGVQPSQLQNSQLWWHGPAWLQTQKWISFHKQQLRFHTEEERKRKRVVTLASFQQVNDLTTRFSSLCKMIRVVAYCRKFVQKMRREHTSAVLTTADHQEALHTIIRVMQQHHFSEEMALLREGEPVQRKSKLLALHPFIDDKGLLRVGGRLENSYLPYQEKHPIIVPHEDPLANLIIWDAHIRTLHGGNQLSLALVRRKYWITQATSKVRQCINKCVRCVRFKQESSQQLMGNLPASRVRMSSPFSSSGVDYAGPIQIRVSKGRGNKSYKGYIAIFVCMATKAVHLEPVSDMTTGSFIAAFKRFQSRKGHCANLYSDNGTTFVGANTVLQQELQVAMKSTGFLQLMASDGTQWHFGPPAAPHFGGLWEAGVKSMKFHLKRVIGDSTLTFEELTTVLCQIEACMNSRPLCVVKNSDEQTIITPAHLLIGRALVVQPDKADIEENPKLYTRWDLTKKMKREFWKIWSSDYLHQLQQRYKWNTPQENATIGDVVLVKDDNIPPTKWPLAKIVEIHPGKDQKIRVVSVKTQHGIYKRPIVKLCKLPVSKVDGASDDTEPTTSTTTTLTSHVCTVRNVQRLNTPSSVMTYLLILCMLCSAIKAGNITSYTIKHPSSGLYVEHLGEALLNRGILRIDIAVNNSKLLEHEEDVRKIITSLQKVCNSVKALSDTLRCDHLIQELEERHHDLHTHFDIIMNGYNTRTRRGILGNLLTSIFGVNDEVYTDIAQLDENQKELIRSSKQQAAIMVKTVTTLNKTEQRITRKLNHFTTKLNEGLMKIEAFKIVPQTVDLNRLDLQLLYLHQLAHVAIAELERTYEALLRVIYHQGHVVDFLTINEFHKLITNVTTKLSPQLQIVTQNMVEMRLERLEGMLMIHCYYHIAEKSTFSLINVTPIPQRVGGDTFAAPIAESSLLAVDYNNQHYFVPSSGDVSEATKLSDDQYLLTTDVIHNMDSSPNCIIDAIYARTAGQGCPSQKFSVPELTWKHLFMQNTWMFISNCPVRVSLDCDGQREDVWLNGTGIIQINTGCSLETRKNILKTRINKRIHQVTAFHKSIPIDVESLRPLNHTSTNSPEPVIETQENFGDILGEERILEEKLDLTYWKQIHPHVVTSGVSILVTMMIVFFILGLLWICYRKRTSIPGTRMAVSKRQPHGPQPSFVLARQDVHAGTALLDI